MKRITLYFCAMLLLASCAKNIPTAEEIKNPEEVKSIAQIDQFIKTTLQQNNKFEWSSADDETIWSALMQSDNIASVGFKPSSINSADLQYDQIDLNSNAWKEAKQAVLQIVFAEESKTNTALKINEQEIWPEYTLPVVDVMIKNFSTIKKLRASNLIRYVEPMGYSVQVANPNGRSSSGCDGNGATAGLVAGTDYTTVSPNAKASWNLAYHGIQSAWTKATGSGIKVFIIDTGLSGAQENLNGSINQGASTGRTSERIVTFPRNTFFGIPIGPVETPEDGCGHGTSMAGACAGPRGTDGNTVGIAYNCNLVVCRAAEDVFMNTSREKKGVADGYTNAANRADVKIISMSMGDIISSGQVADAVRYAYAKGKLMFCAAGTSFGWTAGWVGVIFPAWMPEVNAVTGIKSGAYSRCDVCHDGSETDFTVVMERSNDGLHPLTLANSGDAPSTVGGSSVATASTAGMAALVWSRFPTYTRDQILNKLIANSSFYPTKNGSLGWGNINVNAATN
jgi:subtilisin family serine protease